MRQVGTGRDAAGPHGAGWGLVVPVKALDRAKSRLSPLGADGRRRLAVAMAGDVVAGALACPLVAALVLVGGDEELAGAARALGATTTPDPSAGLDGALAHGAALLRAQHPSLPVAALPGDLPCLRPADLADLLELVGPGRRGHVPDATGTGTTLLLAGAGADLAPAFGRGSSARHAAGGAPALAAAAGLRQDVDTPADLGRALLLGAGPRTAAVAATLPGVGAGVAATVPPGPRAACG